MSSSESEIEVKQFNDNYYLAEDCDKEFQKKTRRTDDLKDDEEDDEVEFHDKQDEDEYLTLLSGPNQQNQLTLAEFKEKFPGRDKEINILLKLLGKVQFKISFLIFIFIELYMIGK
jgi:hypothetical protein